MVKLTEWLENYSPDRDPGNLLADLTGGTPPQDEGDDPEAFFQDLLAPLDIEGLSTKAYSAVFREDAAVGDVETGPQAAVDLYLNKIRRIGELSGGDASKLALAYLKLGKHRESNRCAAFAYLLGDRTSTTLAMLAGLALREGRFTEALVAVAEGRANHPETPEPDYFEALCAFATGNPDRGRTLLAKLTAQHPAYFPAWDVLIDACTFQGRWQDATEYGTQAVALHPREPLLWGRLALSYRHLGNPREALDAIREALRLASLHLGISTSICSRLHLEAAAIEEEIGQFQDAVDRYRELLRSGTPEPAVFLNAASCHKKVGAPREAEALLRRGVGTHPNDPDLLTNLGELLFEARQDQESFELLQKAAEAEPNRTANLFLMAAICARNRRFDAAIELASAVASADADRTTEALVLLGDVYRFQGADAAAVEAYREAARRSQDHGEIRARIEKLTARP